ncbi:cytochrome P460 family protein [Photobacterium ganghwense]|uniref:cytochrome P460 family protein n=1 Tax=Photobacterium ganghwense TaxID=320778 RepID=UPI004056FE3C
MMKVDLSQVKRPLVKLPLVLLFTLGSSGSIAATDLPQPSHGIDYPAGWDQWSAVAVSHRTDNNTIRLILGNELAVKAAREGQTNPWPDGAILAKVVWKDTELENWKAATVPGEFVHAEFMFKDSKRFTETYGWGWARWVGPEQKPFNDGAGVCVACHTPVKDRDWVFTDVPFFPQFK